MIGLGLLTLLPLLIVQSIYWGFTRKKGIISSTALCLYMQLTVFFYLMVFLKRSPESFGVSDHGSGMGYIPILIGIIILTIIIGIILYPFASHIITKSNYYLIGVLLILSAAMVIVFRYFLIA